MQGLYTDCIGSLKNFPAGTLIFVWHAAASLLFFLDTILVLALCQTTILNPKP